ncbi:hypothetical protein EDB84DRAFT_566905 [Lactarius hengduanensis]|nr:hypothetical protein EDB84DRAFT_566905 [Lactarius hengduanensis]
MSAEYGRRVRKSVGYSWIVSPRNLYAHIEHVPSFPTQVDCRLASSRRLTLNISACTPCSFVRRYRSCALGWLRVHMAMAARFSSAPPRAAHREKVVILQNSVCRPCKRTFFVKSRLIRRVLSPKLWPSLGHTAGSIKAQGVGAVDWIRLLGLRHDDWIPSFRLFPYPSTWTSGIFCASFHPSEGTPHTLCFVRGVISSF